MTRSGPKRSVSVPQSGVLGETHDRREREQQRGEGGGEVTHVVQVDNEQRQRESVADAADERAGIEPP